MAKVKPVKDGATVYGADIHSASADQLRQIVCVKCGRSFRYRGTEDDEALELGAGLCTACRQRLSGGPYDGMTIGDLHEN